jgi:hypothetical protein
MHPVSSQIIRLLPLALIVLPAQAASLVTFEGPNAANTYAYKINRAGQVVGWYSTNAAPQIALAYLRQVDGTIVTILPSGANSSTALALNNLGVVAGTWFGSTLNGAFVRATSGTITTFNVPGATFTSPAAINSEGTITGHYLDLQLVSHGFVRDPYGNITTIDVPASQATIPNAINDSGNVAGWYFDNSEGIYQGFIRDAKGGFILFGVPGATMSTYAYGINGSGEVAGYGIGPGGLSLGFVRDEAGTLTVFGAPDTSSTVVYAIDDMSLVTGRAMSATAAVGFTRDASGVIHEFQVPGAGSGNRYGTTAYDINWSGAVTGWFVRADGTAQGFIREP